MSMVIGSSWIRDWTVVENVVGGTTFIDNNSVRITTATTASTDQSYIVKRIPAIRGEKLKLKFKARAVSGSFQGAIFLYNSTTPIHTLTITSPHWQSYDITYIPHDTTMSDVWLEFRIGHLTGNAGECIVTDVDVEVENSQMSVPRVYAMCLLTINNTSAGSVAINENFSCIGINRQSLTTTANTEISLTIPPTNGGDGARSAPVINVGFTFDNSATYKVLPKWGQYNRTTGNFFIRFIDTTTGNLINISSLGLCYLHVHAFGI